MAGRLLLIHAGLPKTGTSAIQAFLAANRTALAAAGVSSPSTGRDDAAGHRHELFLGLAGPDPLRRARLARQLAAEVDGLPGAALVSSEYAVLGLRYGWGAQGFAALRNQGLRLRFLLYLRPQAAFAVSAHPEFLRNLLLPQPFAAFVRRQALPLTADYGALIAELARWGEVRPLPYTGTASWRGLADALGATGDFADPGRVNPSLGAAGVAALEAVLRDCAPQIGRWNARRDLRRIVMRVTQGWQGPEPAYAPLDSALAAEIGAICAMANDAVARRHWGGSWAEVFGAAPAPAPGGAPDPELIEARRAQLAGAIAARLRVIGGRPRGVRAMLGRPLDVLADRVIARRVLGGG